MSMTVPELTRKGVDHLEPQNLIKSLIVKKSRANLRLREKIATWLLVLFGVSVLATYALIFLWGCKKIDLPAGFIHWLGAATISQTAGLLLIIVKNLFP